MLDTKLDKLVLLEQNLGTKIDALSAENLKDKLRIKEVEHYIHQIHSEMLPTSEVTSQVYDLKCEIK